MRRISIWKPFWAIIKARNRSAFWTITNQTKKLGSETEYVDATDQFDKAMAKGCKDDLGNNICDVYEGNYRKIK